MWRLCLVAMVVAHCVVSLSFKHSYALSAYGDVTQSLLLGIATAALAMNAMRGRGIARVFWTLMTAGAAMWLVSTVLWAVYEIALRRDVPNPFVGDIVLFLHLVPMTAALVLQPHAVQPRRYAVFGLLDLALLAFWWLYLYLLIVMPWWWVQLNVSTYGFNVDVCYLLANLLFVASVAGVMLRTRGTWRPFYLHLFGAGVLYAASSQVADVAIDLGRYYTGSLYDIPLVAAMAWFAIAAISARRLEPEQPHGEGESFRPVLWPGRLASLAVLSIPLISWFVLLQSGVAAPVVRFRLIVTLIAVLVLSVLVFCKQHFFSHELVKLVDEANDSYQSLRKVQGQLVQSEKLAALGQLMAGAAHEINNPLTAIIGYSDLMNQGYGEPTALAGKIGQQARRTKALMDDLLSFGRESAANKASLDLNAVATSALRLVNAELVQSRITVHLALRESLPPVLADSNQILQVVMHLIRNAIDSLGASGGGQLKLTTYATTGEAVLEVSDSGSGLDAPEKVFDPFYTTKPVGKGTGLGLSVAYGIIRKHEGEISCRNNESGKGATFRIALPFVPSKN